MKISMILSQVFAQFLRPETVIVDLGSSYTRVVVGDTLLFNEPTCIAFHKQSGAVISIGEQAQRLLGKTPQSVMVLFPVLEGNIADDEATILFLRAVLQKVSAKQSLVRQITGLKGKIGMMPSISPVQQTVFQTVLRQSGFGKCHYFSQSNVLLEQMSATIGDTVTILDIGGQKTACSVFTGGTLVRSTTFPLGGVQITEAIQEYLRREHESLLGWHSAEQIKKEVEIHPNKVLKQKESKIQIRAKDIVSQKSKLITLSSSAFQEPLIQILHEISEQIELFLGQLPTELVTSILDTGIFLTGGTAQLKGIVPVIAEQLHTNIFLSKTPQLDCILGLQSIEVGH